MIRFLFRLLSILALSVSVVLAVIDAARSVAASALTMTPFAANWAWVSPDTLASALRAMSTGAGSLARDVVVDLLGLPGFVVFAALALLFYAIGYRPGPAVGQTAV